MRILLDACVPRALRDSLSDHEVQTAPEMGWGDLDNGALLDAIGDQFDALVTVDKRLPQQQHVKDARSESWSSARDRIALRTCSRWFPHCCGHSRLSAPAWSMKLLTDTASERSC